MANKKALRLIELGLHPVLLGNKGDDLKRPLLKGWQSAVYTPEEVRAWPPRNNIGLRCGRQANGLSLVVLDFDEEADRIFPKWRERAEQVTGHLPVIVTSGRGYHLYFYTPGTHRSRTLAGYYSTEDGRHRLHKFIEVLGEGRQVVSAGSRHPGGKRYRFLGDLAYNSIPTLTEGQYGALVTLSRIYDERPRRSQCTPGQKSAAPAGIQDCLAYARRFIGTQEQVEGNGDIRFLGQGGLLVTADGRGWYSFSDETGGGLAELVTWHQSLVGEGEGC